MNKHEVEVVSKVIEFNSKFGYSNSNDVILIHRDYMHYLTFHRLGGGYIMDCVSVLEFIKEKEA